MASIGEDVKVALSSEISTRVVNSINDECAYVYMGRDVDHEKLVSSTDEEDRVRKVQVEIVSDYVNTVRDIVRDSGVEPNEGYTDFAREVISGEGEFSFDDYPGIIIMGV